MRTIASQEHRNRPERVILGSLLQCGAEEGQLVPEVIRLARFVPPAADHAEDRDCRARGPQRRRIPVLDQKDPGLHLPRSGPRQS